MLARSSLRATRALAQSKSATTKIAKVRTLRSEKETTYRDTANDFRESMRVR